MSLNDSINQGIIDFGLLHDFINGASDLTVPTEGGGIPSLAKIVNNIYGLVTNALVATSTDTFTFTPGTKNFNVGGGKAFKPGQLLIAANATAGFLFGTVLSYTNGVLAMSITTARGNGSASSWNISFSGPMGPAGENGTGAGTGDGSTTPGAPGKSAYEVAVERGFPGTVDQWLISLQGQDLYQLAKASGFAGNLSDFLATFVGPRGKNNYELAQQDGFKGTLTAYLLSLKGEPGAASVITASLITKFSWET